MIDHILQSHSSLKKGETVKIVTTVPDYITYVNRTDLLKDNDDVLEIYRANGARVALNTNFVVMCCIVERL